MSFGGSAFLQPIGHLSFESAGFQGSAVLGFREWHRSHGKGFALGLRSGPSPLVS